MTPALVASSLLDGTLWDMESSPVEIPALVTLVLADIRGGSSTPGMVRQVLQWRAACPQEANSMWASIALLNDKVRALFVKLSDLAKVDFSAYRRDVNACAEPCPEEWAATEVGSVLADIRVTFEAIRRNMKAMGEQCSVGIEPDSQTMLLDKTMSVPGVLCAGVPGGTPSQLVPIAVAHLMMTNSWWLRCCVRSLSRRARYGTRAPRVALVVLARLDRHHAARHYRVPRAHLPLNDVSVYTPALCCLCSALSTSGTYATQCTPTTTSVERRKETRRSAPPARCDCCRAR